VTLGRNHLQAVCVRQPQHVVHREFPTETVVLNLETGTYFGLNPTGGQMLDELNRAASVAVAAARLATAYDQPADVMERDVFSFCAGLIERGLLTVEPAVR
jgi:Coenzyme PQQ synthesis protein D (PqqD)